MHNNNYCKVLFCLSVLLLLPFSAFGLSINHTKFNISLDAQEKYSESIVVNNHSKEEVSVKVYLEDFSYVFPYDGKKEFYSLGSTKYSLQNWVNFSPQEFIIPPGSFQRVTFTIVSDKNFTQTHCGAIFFENAVGNVSDNTGKKIVVHQRLGCLLFVEPKTAEKKVSFKDIKGLSYSLSGEFSNIGNTFLHANGTFYIMDNEGLVKDRGSVRDLYLLPEDKAALEIGFSKDLAMGKYTLVVTFDLEKGDVAVKEIDFSLNESGIVDIIETRD